MQQRFVGFLRCSRYYNGTDFSTLNHSGFCWFSPTGKTRQFFTRQINFPTIAFPTFFSRHFSPDQFFHPTKMFPTKFFPFKIFAPDSFLDRFPTPLCAGHEFMISMVHGKNECKVMYVDCTSFHANENGQTCWKEVGD